MPFLIDVPDEQLVGRIERTARVGNSQSEIDLLAGERHAIAKRKWRAGGGNGGIGDRAGCAFPSLRRQRLIPDREDSRGAIGPAKGLMAKVDARIDDADDHAVSVISREIVSRARPNLISLDLGYAAIQVSMSPS